MENLDLIFNFIGVSVVDWHSAFRFFSETLGFKAELNPIHGDWAVLGGAWDAYYRDGSRSAVFELFDHGRSVSERHWGLNQGIRPGFQVSNVQKVLHDLWARNNISIGNITDRPWGKTVEIITPEGIRFAFAEIPDTPFSDDIASPYVGHVAIKCADFEAMQNFYGNVLGFTRANSGSDFAVFTQKDGHPWVILERGGEPSSFDLRNTWWEDNAVRAFPVFISLMTKDIQPVYAYLKTQEVVILRDIISNQDWGGTDLHIADPDGNGIQVVQYG